MSAHNFEELQRHVGHMVKVVEYSKDGHIYNVAVECHTCNEVLLDYDNPEPSDLLYIPERCPKCDSAISQSWTEDLREQEIRRFELTCEKCSWSDTFEVMMVKWQRATFTIDDQNHVEGYQIPGNHWNGWAIPMFEKDDLLEWLKLEIPGDDRIRYDEDKDAIFCPEVGNDPDHQWAAGVEILTEDGWKHLYGPDGWTWDVVESPHDPCICGHTLEAHVANRGRCGLSGCDCRGFQLDEE